MANSWTAAFFANEARANDRAFASPAAEDAALIYNFAPDFAPADGTSTMFEEIYYFAASA